MLGVDAGESPAFLAAFSTRERTASDSEPGKQLISAHSEAISLQRNCRFARGNYSGMECRRLRFVEILLMSRDFIPSLAMLLCSLSAGLLAANEPPIPLQNVVVDVYHLRDWGTRRFDTYMATVEKQRIDGVAITSREMRYVATQKFVTEVTNAGVMMRQYWQEPTLKHGGALVTYHCRKDSLLSLTRMIVQRDAKTFQVDVTDGEFELDFLAKTRSGKYPTDTVTDAALMRIVTLLPRTPGKVYSIGHRTMTPEINILSGEQSEIRCVGPEIVHIREREMACTKFVSATTQLWVRDSDAMLVRLEIPGWKILELNEESHSDPPAKQPAK
jgi:hypothetical protein